MAVGFWSTVEGELKLSSRLIGFTFDAFEVRNWVGVEPVGRRRLVGSLSVARPWRTASVMRGTMDSTTEAMSCENSLMEGLGGSGGIDWRSS